MLKIRFFVITTVILLLFQNSFAQKLTKKQIDSTYKSLKVLPNSTLKVDNLISLYKKSSKSKIPNEIIIDEAISIAEKIFYIVGLAKSYDRKGLNARYNFDYSNSIIYHKRALNLLNKTTDTFSKVKCLNNLGVSYRKLNLEKESFKVYFEALDLAEKLDNKQSIAISLHGIGNVFIDIEEYAKALHYFKKGYQIEFARGNEKGQEYALSNIGEVYLYKAEYDSAFVNLNKALDLTIKHKRKQGEAIQYNLFGLLFQKQKKYEKSTFYYKRAIAIFTNSNNLRYLSNTLINIGKNQLNTVKYKEAYKNINLGLTNAKNIKSKENISLGYKALVSYYTKTTNFKKALEAHKLATTFQDSIVNEASQKSIISTQIAYETAKKDKKILNLIAAKEEEEGKASIYFKSLMSSIVLGLLIITLMFYLFLLYKKRAETKLQKLNSELQVYMLQLSSSNNKKESTIEEKIIASNLSDREKDVLQYIAKGFTNKEIAEKLFISINTIKYHTINIYSKLDVQNRVQALKLIK